MRERKLKKSEFQLTTFNEYTAEQLMQVKLERIILNMFIENRKYLKEVEFFLFAVLRR